MAVGNDILEGNHVLVATGAMPAALPFPGAEHPTRSEQFLELEALPSRLIFVGGGYISFEFAHVAVRAGADVTILHRGARRCRALSRSSSTSSCSARVRLACTSSSGRRCRPSKRPATACVRPYRGHGAPV